MTHPQIHVTRWISMPVLLGVLLIMTTAGMVSSNTKPVPNSDLTASLISPFTSQGHVLGFQRDGFLLSNAAYAMRVEFVGAHPVTPVSETAPQTGKDAAPPLTHVEYRNLWDGITLSYDAPPGGIVRSTYTVAPFATIESIHLRYNAAVTVNSDGSLSIAYPAGWLSETAPIAWQDVDGRRVRVRAAFVGRGEREVGFALGEHYQHLPVVIDPVLTWNTFLGSGNDDYSSGIALDASGNVYVAGISSATWGNPVRAFTGINNDAFVAKLDFNGACMEHLSRRECCRPQPRNRGGRERECVCCRDQRRGVGRSGPRLYRER